MPEAFGTSNHDIVVPNAVGTEKLSGDVDGYMLYTGTQSTNSNVKSLTAAGNASQGLLSTRDVAGFFVERSAFNGETNASEVLEAISATIAQRYASFSSTGAQAVSDLSVAFSSYALNTGVGIVKKPTELATEILRDVGLNKLDGIITDVPQALDVEPYASKFTVNIGVVYFNESDVSEEE